MLCYLSESAHDEEGSSQRILCGDRDLEVSTSAHQRKKWVRYIILYLINFVLYLLHVYYLI